MRVLVTLWVGMLALVICVARLSDGPVIAVTQDSFDNECMARGDEFLVAPRCAKRASEWLLDPRRRRTHP